MAKKVVTPRERMLAKLKESALTAEDAKRLNLQPFTEQQSAKLNLSRAGAGFKIPYFDSSGKELSMFRYRYFDTAHQTGFLKGVKLRKYDQPLNTPVEIYLPRLAGVNWSEIKQDATTPLIITEGELKAACATKHEHPTIGIGGVFSFGSRKLGVEFLPSLEAFEWALRRVYICYDSDLATNPDVLLAECRLAAILARHGASVFIVRLPGGSDGKKVGLDDYIVKRGAKALDDLLDDATLTELSESLLTLFARYLYVTGGSYILDTEAGERYTVTQFINELTANRFVKDGNREVSAGREFMKSAARPEVAREVYAPGAARIVDSNFNRWQGWGVEPAPGDVKPFLELVELLVPDAALRTWFLDWCAWPLQHPGAKLSTAVVLVSPQGVGKSTFADVLRAVYGAENSASIDQRALDSEFNAPLAGKQFIVGEETTTTGRDARRRADIVKNLITAPTLIVNEKYKPQVELANAANFLFLTNHADAFYLDESDRRFAVIESAAPPRSAEFYARLRKWLENGGATHLFDYLLHRDLRAFNPHAHAPRSAAKAAMIDASRTALGQWVHQLREDPDAVVVHERSPLRRVLSLHTSEELLVMFDGGQGRCTPKAVARELRVAGFVQACGGQQVRVGRTDETRKRFWITRNSEVLVRKTLAQMAQMYGEERGTRHPAPKFAAQKGGKSAS